MSNKKSPNLPRNRRFLVSIWHKSKLISVQENPTDNEETGLHGLVWEADPRDPGRITTPESFATLSALPGIFDRFLYPAQNDRNDASLDLDNERDQ